MNSKNTLIQTLLKIEGAYAHATIRAYRADFLKFIAFCESRNEDSLPAKGNSVCAFINQLIKDGLRSASITRAIAGIASIHILNEMPDPTKENCVRLEMRRMYRQLGRYKKQVAGLNRFLLDKMLSKLGSNLHDIRDRALLLVAYDTLCRRSEVVDLRAEDIWRHKRDYRSDQITNTILLRKSKTDQERHGHWVQISDETLIAIDLWLAAANIHEGYIFRGITRTKTLTDKLDPGNIGRIYKRLAKRARLDKAVISSISGHSTRIGAAQDLLLSGNSLPLLMHRGRWTKPETVMRYVENISAPL